MTVQKIDISQIANTGGLAGQVLVSNGTSVTWGDANNTAFVGSVSAVNVVSNAQLSANLGNYQTTAGLSANVATLTANNTTNFNSQPASFYTNATNITTGTLPYAQIPANIVNTTAAFTLDGNITFSSNLTIGATGELIIANAAGIYANGGLGTSGQVLTSNGSAVYWSTSAGATNVDAQYAWTNTQTFSNTITFSQTINGTANNTSFVGSVSAANVVSNAQLSANLGNYQTTAGLAANVAILTANNANNLGGVAAASYVNTSGAYTLSGNINFTSNLTINATAELIIANGAGIYANGGLGTSGQVLTSNGSAVYWSTSAGGGGGGISSLSFVGFYSGYNNPTTGTLKRYFANNITVTKMTAWVGVTSGSNLKLTLKKNGSEIANTTITAGANTSNVTFSSNVTSDVDYLTLDLTSGSGTDIGVRIDYAPYA
jgi:hypothetical protein